MSDYTQINDYSAKDALSTGNPLKIIKGSDIDGELAAIAVAMASKFDTTDVASAAEAQAGILNTVVITPGRLTSWAQNGAGVLEDIQTLLDPGADRLLFFDFSAGSGTFLQLSGAFNINDTTLELVTGAGGGASADLILTAGNGLAGGGDLTASRTFDLDYNELVAATIAAGDELSFGDIDDTNIVKKITFANFEASLTIANMADYVANEGVDHSTVTITAGEGLTGGGDITASRTIDMSITTLTEEAGIDPATDWAVFYDQSGTAHRKIQVEDLVGAELGDAKIYVGANQAISAATETTVDYDTVSWDNLTRGTFNITTNEYTATVATKIMINAAIQIAAMNDDEAVRIIVERNGVEELYSYYYNDTDNDTPIHTQAVNGLINCGASDTVRIRTLIGSAETITSGAKNSYLCITELS